MNYKFSAASSTHVNFLCSKLQDLFEADTNLAPWRIVFPIEKKEFQISEVKASTSDFSTASCVSKHSLDQNEENEIANKKMKLFNLKDGEENVNNCCVEELSVEMQNSVTELKEILQRSSDNAALSIDERKLTIFNKISSVQMEQVCHQLMISNLSENSLAAICLAAILLEPELSFCNCTIFARHCFKDKLLSLKESPSRLFLGTVINFAQKFPKQFIENAAIFCLKDIDCFQSDILCKLVKETFLDDHRNCLLSEILTSCDNFSDFHISLLQSITQSMTYLQEENLNAFVSKMIAITESQPDNLKLVKYFLSFINKYSSQLLPEHVTNIIEVFQHNKTFLKKAVLTALKKLT